MKDMLKGNYRLRIAANDTEVLAAQRLRAICFHPLMPDGQFAEIDRDDFDSVCTHVLIEEVETDRLVACFRMLTLSDGSEIERSYSAQFYHLGALAVFPGSLVEIGRFCMHPDVHDPNIVRIAWEAIAEHVEENQIGMLFGCSSFHGTEVAGYWDTFELLRLRHIAPPEWQPQVKAPQVVRFADRDPSRLPDQRAGMAAMPPLLRSYLKMGGWVSDHAVIDRQMETVHVFTGLETKNVPANRRRSIRRCE